MNNLKTYLPEKKSLTSDLSAGLTFALVNIPQSMAHALLASVNPLFGLYTLMMATPVAALFTSAVFMNVSTTSALAVAAGDVLSGFPASERVPALAALVLMVGVFQIILGVLRLGWVTRFIPFSVMTGFLTGVAVLIILGQLGDITGYYSTYSGKIVKLADLVLNRKSIEWATLAIGILTLFLVYVFNRTRLSRFSLILALVIASATTMALNQVLADSIKIVGEIADIPRSLPTLAIPDTKLLLLLILPAITVGIIGLVQGAGVSQSFPNPDGKYSDSSRDFLGQGVANLATSFISGIPAGGSSSGSALIVNAGARTRWANIFAGVAVTLIVLVFANLVEMVAMPALAALVIIAGVQMINVNNIRTVWNTNLIARIIMIITFGSTIVMPLQYAVLLGVGLSLILFVFQQSNTLRIVEWDASGKGWPIERPAPKKLESRKVTMLYIYGNLFYAAAKTFEDSLPAVEGAQNAAVILLMRGYEDIGSTVIGVIHRYAKELQACDGKLILAGVSARLHEQLRRTGIEAMIGGENIFASTATIGEAGNAALSAATDWLAVVSPSIDHDESN